MECVNAIYRGALCALPRSRRIVPHNTQHTLLEPALSTSQGMAATMDAIKEDEELIMDPDVVAMLCVTVVAAKNLLAKDLNGCGWPCRTCRVTPRSFSDPYVRIEIDGLEVAQTTVKERNLNPIWNEVPRRTLPARHHPHRSRSSFRCTSCRWPRLPRRRARSSSTAATSTSLAR